MSGRLNFRDEVSFNNMFLNKNHPNKGKKISSLME